MIKYIYIKKTEIGRGLINFKKLNYVFFWHHGAVKAI